MVVGTKDGDIDRTCSLASLSRNSIVLLLRRGYSCIFYSEVNTPSSVTVPDPPRPGNSRGISVKAGVAGEILESAI